MFLWQSLLEQQPESAITFGLARCQAVRDALALTPALMARRAPPPKIITVAGTNGKGSTCAYCAEILQQHGLQVGLFTSPHLLQFHERIRINGEAINDAALDAAMLAVEKARQQVGVSLSYFERATLAAWWHFCVNDVTVMVLEVGLGGRLDAVNVWDADVAVIATIDLDHQAYLGDTRALIGLEKAAIARAERPVLCADLQPPEEMLSFLRQLGAHLQRINVDFTVQQSPHLPDQWSLQWRDQPDLPLRLFSGLPLPRLRGGHQLRNAAVAIRAVQTLLQRQNEALTLKSIRQALIDVKLGGRLEVRPRVQGDVEVWLDVAHNAQAAKTLAQSLPPVLPKQKVWAVLAMLADKDVAAVVQPFLGKVDGWCLAGLETLNPTRGLSAEALTTQVATLIPESKRATFSTPAQALAALLAGTGDFAATGNDRIIVFGSFHTVSSCQSLLTPTVHD